MIEILLTTYNGQNYIREQLDSILNQTIKEFIITINDDCSTDSTYRILEEYKNRYPEKITLTQHKCGSSAANLFFLLKHSKGDIVMMSDQDDYWKKDKIEKLLSLFNKINDKTKPCLVFSDMSVVDEKLNMIENSFMKYQKLNPYRSDNNQLIIQNVIPCCTIMCNRECVNVAIKKDSASLPPVCDCWLGLVASTFGKIEFLNESTFLYRQHRNNVVGAKKNRGFRYVVNQLRNLDIARNSIERSRQAARMFGETYNLPLFIEYGRIGEKNRFNRIRFHIKNRIFYNGIIENIALLILC